MEPATKRDVQYWKRVDEIFGTILEARPLERDARLEALCGGDSALRSDVARLLESDQRVDAGFLEPRVALRPPSSDDGSDLAFCPRSNVRAVERWVGRRVAGLTLTRCIGVGGMGAVYEAVQDRPRRTVALKLILAAMASPQRLRRFMAEAEILAGLHHPNIAQVYQAGTDDGPDATPYMALELIPNAASITEWVRNHTPDRRARLDLFLRVCEAVQYLHQRGVIHRDIKPANVLVADGYAVPQVKIIDFGVARLVEGDPAATRVTDVNQLVGTLGYMSPEQLRGDSAQVDTRSDVYALGVLLFELLTDQRPHDVSVANLPEAIRALHETEPRRLSSLDPGLGGDLETIVLKALERQPERRYPSVEALAEDLCRLRDGRMINARPPTLGYQLARLVARHKAVSALSCVFLVCLIGFSLTVGTLYLRSESQRARAEQAELSSRTEAQAAREVADYLVNLFQTLDPWADLGIDGASTGGPTMLELLDGEARAIPEKLKNQPLTQAAALTALADVYVRREMFARAATVVRSALELRRGTLGPDDPSVAETAACLGKVLIGKGDYRAAEGALNEALAIHRRLAATQPDFRSSEAYDLQSLGLAACNEGRFLDAGNLLGQASEIHGQLHPEDHPAVLAAMLHLAQAQRLSGDCTTSAATCREVLNRCPAQQSAGDCRSASVGLSEALRDQGDYAGAEAVLLEAQDRRRQSEGPGAPDDPGLMIRMAALHKTRGDLQGAETLYRQALGLFQSQFGADYARVSGIHYHLVGLLAANRDAEGLATLHRELMAEHQRALQLPEDDPARSGAALHLGDIMLVQGDAAGAEPLLRECVDLRRRALSPEHWLTAFAETLLGECLADQGRFEEAEPLLVTGHRRVRTKLGAGDVRTLRSGRSVVELYESWGRREPDQGHEVRAAEWRARLDARCGAEAPPTVESTRSPH